MGSTGNSLVLYVCFLHTYKQRLRHCNYLKINTKAASKVYVYGVAVKVYGVKVKVHGAIFLGTVKVYGEGW